MLTQSKHVYPYKHRTPKEKHRHMFSPSYEITPEITGPHRQGEKHKDSQAHRDGQQTLRETYRFSETCRGTYRYTPHRHSSWRRALMRAACMGMPDARVHPSEPPATPRRTPITLPKPKTHPSPGMAQVLSATCSIHGPSTFFFGQKISTLFGQCVQFQIVGRNNRNIVVAPGGGK